MKMIGAWEGIQHGGNEWIEMNLPKVVEEQSVAIERIWEGKEMS
jgi:hypothetical protein